MRLRLTLSNPKRCMNTDGISMGCYLSAFTHWLTGRPISSLKNLRKGICVDGFSQLIWDLVDYISSNSPSKQRLFGDKMSFMLSMSEDIDVTMNSSMGTDNVYWDAENGGFGILFIDMGND